MSLPCYAARPRFLIRKARCARIVAVRFTLSFAFATALVGAVVLIVVLPPASSAQSAADFSWHPESENPDGSRRVLAPVILGGLSTSGTGTAYAAIPVQPPPTNRPAASHADLNLALRGYAKTTGALGLVSYGGATDWSAPQMPGIFSDRRTPRFTSVHRVYDWNWGCGPDGCRASLISSPPVTLLGLGAAAGELISAPSRGAEIYGGYTALVLYADEHRITLKYTRDDNVVAGYTVHLEKVNVDPALLQLYRRSDSTGRAQLPALKDGQPLGRAAGGEVLVAIRDSGAFLDPRSGKDWWQGR